MSVRTCVQESSNRQYAKSKMCVWMDACPFSLLEVICCGISVATEISWCLQLEAGPAEAEAASASR